jgi:hypothetical protein
MVRMVQMVQLDLRENKVHKEKWVRPEQRVQTA